MNRLRANLYSAAGLLFGGVTVFDEAGAFFEAEDPDDIPAENCLGGETPLFRCMIVLLTTVCKTWFLSQ